MIQLKNTLLDDKLKIAEGLLTFFGNITLIANAEFNPFKVMERTREILKEYTYSKTQTYGEVGSEELIDKALLEITYVAESVADCYVETIISALAGILFRDDSNSKSILLLRDRWNDLNKLLDSRDRYNLHQQEQFEAVTLDSQNPCGEVKIGELEDCNLVLKDQTRKNNE